MCTVWVWHSKWLSKWSNKSASNFEIRLNIPAWKLFQWVRRLQLWATGDWQLHHNSVPYSCDTSCLEFFGETSNHPGDLAPLPPRFGTLWLPGFPKTKITFEREEISDCLWDSGKYDGNCNWRKLGELCEVPRCPWRGPRCHCPMYNVSCILYLLQWMSLFFILHGWIPSRQTSYLFS